MYNKSVFRKNRIKTIECWGVNMWLLKEYLGIGRLKSSVFYNMNTDDYDEIDKLESLYRDNKIDNEEKYLLKEKICNLRSILDGNKNVIYELDNTNIPMYYLKDIYIKYEDKYVRFDFIILTKKLIIVLDTTSLIGDIAISEYGDFRKYIKEKNLNTFKKRAMNNPIENIEESAQILIEVLIKEKLIRSINIETKLVISNPKSIVSRNKAPLEIKNKILKYDEIQDSIIELVSNSTNSKDITENTMLQIANFLTENSLRNVNNFVSDYRILNSLSI